jgi:hypothetical protein
MLLLSASFILATVKWRGRNEVDQARELYEKICGRCAMLPKLHHVCSPEGAEIAAQKWLDARSSSPAGCIQAMHDAVPVWRSRRISRSRLMGEASWEVKKALQPRLSSPPLSTLPPPVEPASSNPRCCSQALPPLWRHSCSSAELPHSNVMTRPIRRIRWGCVLQKTRIPKGNTFRVRAFSCSYLQKLLLLVLHAIRLLLDW